VVAGLAESRRRGGKESQEDTGNNDQPLEDQPLHGLFLRFTD